MFKYFTFIVYSKKLQKQETILRNFQPNPSKQLSNSVFVYKDHILYKNNEIQQLILANRETISILHQFIYNILNNFFLISNHYKLLFKCSYYTDLTQAKKVYTVGNIMNNFQLFIARIFRAMKHLKNYEKNKIFNFLIDKKRRIR